MQDSTARSPVRPILDPSPAASPPPRPTAARPWLRRLAADAAAAALVAALVALRWFLAPVLTYAAPYQLTYPAVMLVALVLGVRPAMVASTVAVLGTELFLVAPFAQLQGTWLEVLRVGGVFFGGAFVGLLGARLKHARAAAAASAASARNGEVLARAQSAELRAAVAALEQAQQAREQWQLEDRRRAAELETLLSSMAEGLVLYGNHGEIRRMNRAAEEILGYAWDELAALPADAARTRMMAFEGPDGGRVRWDRTPVARALRGERVGGDELLVRRPDGSQVWILASAAPILGPQGEPAGVVSTFSNITDRKQAEAALRQSEEKFRSIFERAAIGMGRVRFSDARWIDVNDSHCRLLGYSRDEMLTVPWPEITHPDDVEADLVPFCRMAAGELDHYQIEKRFIHKQGHPVWARLTLSLVRDDRGRPDYEVAVIEDIDARKRAEQHVRESEERFKAFAETIPHLAFITDAAGNVTFNNGRFFDYFGIHREEAEAGGWRNLPLHPEDLKATLRGWVAGMRHGDPFRLEYRLRRHDGQYRWHVTQVAPVLDERGRPSMWVGTSVDVHEQRVAALALQQANEQLLEADRRKNEFLAVLSHELRNPLAPIRNSVHILERTSPGGDQARRARQVIDRQAQHMTRLIDDLLDVTRISRGKIVLQRERLDLVELARSAAEDHRDLFTHRGVRLVIDATDEPVWVEGDRIRLAQVVGNLLSNSVKFTPRGGSTELAVAAAGGHAVVRVRDTGAGMSSETLSRVFEPFVQAPQTLDRSPGGLGLGLSLVKGLVELHGGTVRAHSEGLGRGSELELTLPLQAAAERRPVVRPPPVRPEPAEHRRRRVLVIEDNPDAAESLREALELGEHEVAVAYSGPEGLATAHSFAPDVVVCDIGLPGLDGYGVARAMRADPALRSAFLVALTGYALHEDMLRCREAGFDRHMAKPPSIDALESAIADAPPRIG